MTHLKVLLPINLHGFLLSITAAAVLHRSEDGGGDIHIVTLSVNNGREQQNYIKQS